MMMKKHVNLNDVVEANNLLMSMGAEDQLPTIASAAIERSLELQHRVDRAIRYAEEAHSSSLHVKQVLRILDGSITIDDENNEVPEKEYPHLVQRAAHEQQALPAAPAKFVRDGSSGLAGRSTAERKAFRDWCAERGIDLPLNQPVPQHVVDAFDEATEGRHKPKPRKAYNYGAGKGPRGKLKPGHGLDGRSPKERLHLRDWLSEQGYDISPTGRIPQKYIDHYDAAMAELKRMQREQREQREQPQQQEQEQHAQGA
jgi:hypothetical protein